MLHKQAEWTHAFEKAPFWRRQACRVTVDRGTSALRYADLSRVDTLFPRVDISP